MKNEIMKNENKGFSLVELIVVIAIMAVLTAVLAPALLKYVEDSRAQKDDSAMSEVTHAVKLALANQNVYDECLAYSFGNKAGDKANYANYSTAADEVRGTAEGEMRGLTITFCPTDYVITLDDAKVNDIPDATYDGTQNGANDNKTTLSAMTAGTGAQTGVLAGELKATIGSTVRLTSKTYRNSDYTVFIKMGNLSEAIQVTGQWDGTNVDAR